MYKICISCGIVLKFLSCAGYAIYHLCEIYYGFCVPKITQISWFLTE